MEIVQANLRHQSVKPDNFEEFKKDFELRGLDYCLKKYGKMNSVEKYEAFFISIDKKS